MRQIVLFLLLVCIIHARLLCSLFGCLCFSVTWLYVPRIKMSNVKELGMWHFYSLFIAIIQIMRERETLPKWEIAMRQKAYMKWSRRINSFKEKNSNSKKCLSLKRIEGRVWKTVDECNTMMMGRDNDSVGMKDKTLKKRVQRTVFKHLMIHWIWYWIGELFKFYAFENRTNITVLRTYQTPTFKTINKLVEQSQIN